MRNRFLVNRIIEAPPPQEIDNNLCSYQDIHHMVSSWVVLAVGDPRWVFEWRLQAEVAMRAAGRAGMTDEQVQHNIVQVASHAVVV